MRSTVGALAAMALIASAGLTVGETPKKSRKAAEPRNVNPDRISGLPRSKKARRNLKGKP